MAKRARGIDAVQRADCELCSGPDADMIRARILLAIDAIGALAKDLDLPEQVVIKHWVEHFEPSWPIAREKAFDVHTDEGYRKACDKRRLLLEHYSGGRYCGEEADTASA